VSVTIRVEIKIREKNDLIAIFRLCSVACSMFTKDSASFSAKSNFVLPKAFMEQPTRIQFVGSVKVGC